MSSLAKAQRIRKRPPSRGWVGREPPHATRSPLLCRPFGRSALVSGAVAAETTMRLIALGEHDLRGIAAPCAVFTLPED
jgi:hypothetical protein